MLRNCVPTRAFADADLFRIPADQFAYAVSDQMVVKHHVSVLQHLQAAPRQ
ncbi:hypothetical protein D3C79_1085010 [compost metagenome]